MAENKEIFNAEGACPCKHCRRLKRINYPVVDEVAGLFYARCTGCQRYEPFTFLGTTRKNAIRAWNDLMLKKGGSDD